jgi:hypothetical protein
MVNVLGYPPPLWGWPDIDWNAEQWAVVLTAAGTLGSALILRASRMRRARPVLTNRLTNRRPSGQVQTSKRLG